MPVDIIYGDITEMQTDAIVNAANSSLQMGGGVCGAIFRKAGSFDLQQACAKIGVCETGNAVFTPGFQLPAKYIIHTVGPIWQGGSAKEATLLASCYQKSLQLASDLELQSISFPLISSGIYGYPYQEALQIATDSIRSFLEQAERDLMVYLVLLAR